MAKERHLAHEKCCLQPEAWTRHLDQAAGQRAWVLAPEKTGYQLEKYKAVRLMREQTTILCRQGRSPVVRMILTAPQQGREALCRQGCFLWRKKNIFLMIRSSLHRWRRRTSVDEQWMRTKIECKITLFNSIYYRAYKRSG